MSDYGHPRQRTTTSIAIAGPGGGAGRYCSYFCEQASRSPVLRPRPGLIEASGSCGVGHPVVPDGDDVDEAVSPLAMIRRQVPGRQLAPASKLVVTPVATCVGHGEASGSLPPAEKCSHSSEADARTLALTFCAVVDARRECPTAWVPVIEPPVQPRPVEAGFALLRHENRYACEPSLAVPAGERRQPRLVRVIVEHILDMCRVAVAWLPLGRSHASIAATSSSNSPDPAISAL